MFDLLSRAEPPGVRWLAVLRQARRETRSRTGGCGGSTSRAPGWPRASSTKIRPTMTIEATMVEAMAIEATMVVEATMIEARWWLRRSYG